MTSIAMLSTGEEVLHGDIVDTNAAWLSRRFYQKGFALSKRTTVGDQKQDLVTELVSLSLNHDVVIVNGGLGPTTDDLSAEAAALAAEQSLVLFPEWVKVMEQMFLRTGREMPDTNLKQAKLPEKAIIIDNPIGTACGFSLVINDALFFFTPGVPSEFKRMVEEQIIPSLSQLYPQTSAYQVSRLYTFGLGESGIATKLDKLHLPAGFELGYRSYLPYIEVKLFGPEEQQETRIKLLKIIYSHIADNVVSVDEPMLDNLAKLISDANLTLSVAEMCTGGYLSSQLQGHESICEHFKQAWVLNNVNAVGADSNDPIAEVLALAASIREKTAVDVGFAVGKLNNNEFAVAISTASGEWGQLMRLKRNYAKEDQTKVIATILLDMFRRLQERKSVFGEYGFIERIRELFVPSSTL